MLLRFLGNLFLGLLLLSELEPSLGQTPLLINIDSPTFRKLITAVPAFTLEPGSDKQLQGLGEQASSELSRLLEFTGYFNLLSPSAFKGVPTSATSTSLSSAIPGFEGVDLLQWKSLGVESLTLAKLVKTPTGGLRLELRTADINRGASVLGKAYTLKGASEFDQVLKQYVDRLLMAYTGKPGIFASKITFTGRKSKGTDKQVYICDIDGKNLQQVTNERSIHVSPAWHPNGTHIVYTSYHSGNPDLYAVDLASRKVTKLAGQRGLNSGGAYAPNAKLVAYSGSVGGNTEIYLKDLQTGKERIPFLQGHGIDVDPAFSPDNKWLAFVSGRFGNPHIFRAELVWNPEGSQVKIISDKRLTYAGWWNATPAWSPDSQKLAFGGFDRDTNRWDIFMMNHDGTQLERLTLHTADNENPSFSPNGQLLVFNSNRMGEGDRKGTSQLYIMQRDGSAQRPIPTNLYEADNPRWGPFMLRE